jgi:putative ABC transport system substrate-binding protein
MRRREFLGVVSGATAAILPFAARAQPLGGLRRLGILFNGPEHDPVSVRYKTAFEQSLRVLGWFEDRNIQIDRRWSAGNPALTRLYAPELVALAPDALMCLSSTNLQALQQASRSIPIVFALVSDPVAQGFVPNLARPGGNITGFTAYESSVANKWMDLLRQLSPGLSRVGLMFNPEISVQSRQFLASMQAAAPSFGIEVIALPVRSVTEVEPAVAGLAQGPKSGLVVPTDQFLSAHRKLLISHIAQHRVPTIYAQHEFVADGGLMFYGIDQVEQVRRAAIYVDRILKGAKAGDLPVQNPTKYQSIISIKAARALGVEVPLSLLLTADEVIE